VPTVTLAEQQQAVIDKGVDVPVGLISGANQPDQWKDQALWQRVLTSYRIIVSTPDVLLNALRHGYIQLGHNIGFLVFDEAHHAADRHAYNLIMREFYADLPPRSATESTDAAVRPMILGLTASPIFGGNVETSLR
jgi:endoribonuclease Dicer